MEPMIQGFLPSINSNGGKTFDEKTRIPPATKDRSMTSLRQSRIQQDRKIVNLFLTVAKETAETLSKAQYTAFDALVKNFGCQITAFEVHRLVCNEALQEEAEQLNREIPQLKQEVLILEKAPHTLQATAMSLSELVSSALPNIAAYKVSQEMMRLIRFRLLSIVNDNKSYNGREVPFTNTNALLKYEKLEPKLINSFIEGLQVDESKRAVDYIQKIASQLPESDRKPIICRALQTVRYNKVKGDHTSLPLTPLLYNVEACLRGFQGVVLVKNKLSFCKQPIAEAIPIQVYLRMPGEVILTSEEVKQIREEEPVFVIEAYMKTPNFAEVIEQKGLLSLVQIEASQGFIQFVGCSNAPIDEEIEQDRRSLEEQRSTIEHLFEIDHMFCSSIKDEGVVTNEVPPVRESIKADEVTCATTSLLRLTGGNV